MFKSKRRTLPPVQTTSSSPQCKATLIQSSKAELSRDSRFSHDVVSLSNRSPAHTQEEVEEEDPAEESPDFSDEHLNYCLKSDEFSSQESWRIQNESDDTDIVSSTSTLPIFSNLVPAALKSAGTLPLIDLTGKEPGNLI